MTARELIEALGRAPNLDRAVEVIYDDDDGMERNSDVDLVYADPEYDTADNGYNHVTLDLTRNPANCEYAVQLWPSPQPQKDTP